MQGTSHGRVLVLDLRADRIGYAAFETPDRLLDYGTSRFAAGEAGRARAEFLLRALDPSILVLRRPRTRSTRRSPRWTGNRRVIEREAKLSGVPVAFVGERKIKTLFAEFNCRNKFQIAERLGAWFPEIARNVPRTRKCYEPEPWTIAYFDAIALGVAYFILTAHTTPSIRRDDGMILSSASK